MAVTAAQQASYTQPGGSTPQQSPGGSGGISGLPNLPPPPDSGGSGGLGSDNLGSLAGTILKGSGNLFGQGQDLTFQDALNLLRQLQPGDPTAAQIQNDLLVGGFYPKGANPLLGTIRPQDITAFKNALSVPAKAGADVGDYLQSVASASQQAGPLGSLVETTTHAIDLTDPAAIGDQLDQMYESALGRKAHPEERAAFTAQFQNDQRAYYNSLYNAADSARRNYLEADANRQSIQAQARANGISSMAPDVGSVSPRYREQVRDDQFAGQTSTVTPDNVSNYGTELAGKYGLTVTSGQRTPEQNAAVGGAPNSDHLTGMAVDISSNPSDPRTQDKLNALAAFARNNEGPGKLFRWVGWEVPGHYDHVHLSFNAQVTDPQSFQQLQTLQSNSTPAAQGTPNYSGTRDAFLMALRQVEDSGSYDWNSTSQAGAKGAYQFMPGTWASAAKLAGIDPNDHSPQAQDAAARALVDQYYKSFNGDWSLVAAAWNGGVGTAKRIQGDPSVASRIGDGNMTVANYMQRVMGAFASTGAMNGGTGLANDVMGVPISQTIERTNPALTQDALQSAREQHPIEAAGHDMAQTYDVFAKLLGGVVQPDANADPRSSIQGA